MAEGLLTKSDRAGMLWGIEFRAPFLDRAVMEFAAALPEKERVHRLTTKVFLKRYAARYLPGEILQRRKHGLSVPLARWFRSELRDWAASHLSSPRLNSFAGEPEERLKLLAEHGTRSFDHARAIWTLIVLDEWLAWIETQQRSRADRPNGDRAPAPMTSSAPA